MTDRYALLFLLLTPASLVAQTQNALDLDGVDDEVTVANASALIANSTAGFSLACWVYPTQSANWPNMEAFAGFRDNFGCDFYLLQTYGTTMEGRFRNSSNGIFTIDTSNVLTLNTWQHVALTYDGAVLTMYHNGAVVASAAANGNVTSTTGQFQIGNMSIPGSTQIYLDGQVDETMLWKRGLTQAEVQCIMNYGADPADADLQLYFKMDQGIAGAANPGLGTLINAAGPPNGTLVTFALNGSTSNYVAGCPIAGTASATICQGENYVFNGQTLTTAGTYSTSYPVGGSCDSLATLNLAVIAVNTTVVQSGGLLISQALGAQYQWLDCANGYAVIAGATAAQFPLTTAGSYAVQVTQNGCTDTSACVTVVGLEELSALAGVQVRHDAAQDQVVVSGTAALNGGRVDLFDARGRAMRSQAVQQDRTLLSTAGLSEGLYLVQVGNALGRRSFRVVVTR